MISEERGARSDEMVGGRPSIYRGLFNEFKMQLMITGPRACELYADPFGYCVLPRRRLHGLRHHLQRLRHDPLLCRVLATFHQRHVADEGRPYAV